MSTLDEITREKQRVSEALARVDAQREKLAGQVAELEATERVLARYSKGSGVRRTAAARTPTSPRNPAAPARAGGTRRGTITRPPGSQRSSPNPNSADPKLSRRLRWPRDEPVARYCQRNTRAPAELSDQGRLALG